MASLKQNEEWMSTLFSEIVGENHVTGTESGKNRLLPNNRDLECKSFNCMVLALPPSFFDAVEDI